MRILREWYNFLEVCVGLGFMCAIVGSVAFSVYFGFVQLLIHGFGLELCR